MTPPSPPDIPNRRTWSGPAQTDAPTPSCLDEDTLGALAEGSLDEATRSAALPHLAGCAHCGAAVASLARALADPGLAAEIEAVASPPRRRWLAWSGALAAALALVLLVPLKTFWNKQPGPHRAPVVVSGALPASLAPAGDVAQVEALHWAPVSAANRYRVTLFAPSGRVLYEATPSDTFVVLPDSVALAPGIRYLWKVEARVGFDRWVSSDLVGFTLLEGARP